jgi:hypothetical protein
MKIVTTCNCGKRLWARQTLAGCRVKCPECGAIVVLPSLDSQVLSVPEHISGPLNTLEAERNGERDAPDVQSPKPESSVDGMLVGAYLLFAFVLVVVHFLLFVLLGVGGLLVPSGWGACLWGWRWLCSRISTMSDEGRASICAFGWLIITVTWWLACASTVSWHEMVKMTEAASTHTGFDGRKYIQVSGPNPVAFFQDLLIEFPRLLADLHQCTDGPSSAYFR